MHYMLIAVSDPDGIDILRRDSSVEVDVLIESDSLLTISTHALITSDEGRQVTQSVRRTRKDLPRKPSLHLPGYSCRVCGKPLLPGRLCHPECEPAYYSARSKANVGSN